MRNILPRHAATIFTAVLLVFFAASPTTIRAQESPSLVLKVGAVSARQTFSYHNFSLTELPVNDRWGLAAGAELRLMRVLGADIQAELLYVQKGTTFFDVMETTPAFPEGTGRMLSIDVRTDYLTISGSAKINVLSGPISPFLRFGPRMDLLLRNPYEFSLRTADIGMTAGIGAEVSIGPLPVLVLEGRINPDLTSAYEGEFLTIDNRSFELLLGLGF